VENQRDRPILVVDDDAKIVRLVRTYLEREGYSVVEAADGRSALEAIERDDPALVVLDVMLPEIDGLSIVRAVRRKTVTPIVILSARGTTSDRIAGLGVGADDYLPKPFSPAELVLRVQRVLARTGASPPTDGKPALECGDLSIDLERHEVTLAGRPVALTAVEFRLLVTLLQADGRVRTRDQLLDAIYGMDAGEILDRTIDVHVGRLREKLGDSADESHLISTVRGVGYRAVPRRSVRPDPGP
jgi:DNA-binding response OmpR family regulator